MHSYTLWFILTRLWLQYRNPIGLDSNIYRHKLGNPEVQFHFSWNANTKHNNLNNQSATATFFTNIIFISKIKHLWYFQPHLDDIRQYDLFPILYDNHYISLIYIPYFSLASIHFAINHISACTHTSICFNTSFTLI